MTREEAVEWLEDVKNITENWSQDVATDMAIEALSAEAVEVVRCKDCKFKDSETRCPLGELLDDNGFCSLGERREP